MHPSSLLSYYPSFSILDEIMSYGKYNQLNIYIDLKNTLQTTYMEHAIINILESTQRSKFFDTSIFSSLISFLAFHKRYALDRNIKLNFIIFFETGQSMYHKNISKEYKVSRRIDDLYGLDNEKRELFYNVLQRNFQLIESACNKIPNVKVIRLKNMEADFVPYYLTTRKVVDMNPHIVHVIYSNDHDLLQCLNENVYVYQKVMAKVRRIAKSGQAMELELKLKKKIDIEDEYQPLAMAIIGDPGDDVYGIKGIGPVTFVKCFPELKKLIGNMDELYENVLNDKPIFDLSNLKVPNKNTQKIIKEEETNKTISKNLKLVSFELISRAIESYDSLEMTERSKQINNIVKNNEIANIESLTMSLTKVGVELEHKALDILYHQNIS